ncbi:MAG TPA: amino acid ABC transporter ATP-binding protein [Acidothermaceae bacterium]|jgi:polar amino acid transport system ATP-binding protein|nr:amino acid ABC transporter ATP-binding protein [Acidothermaceae bacterium]
MQQTDSHSVASSSPREPLLRVRGAQKAFGATTVLRGIDLDVFKGEVVCLLGASGSGKSTLLRGINHLVRLDAGQVLLDGELIGYRKRNNKLYEVREEAICRRRSEIAMVFQNFNLFPHLTVLDNITIGPRRVLKISTDQARAHARELLTAVGLGGKADSYPGQLSGGQQQRVAIARGLAMKPKLMLFDEPTSALDPQLVGEVLTVIAKLAADGMTMVIVTHEMRFARQAADRIVFMADGEVLHDSPPEGFFDNQANPRIRSFLGQLE